MRTSLLRAEVRPQLPRWARERAGFSAAALAGRFPKLEAWDRGEGHPTLEHVESFALATYAPVGFLFLREPPVETVPVPHFRAVENAHVGHPSLDLLGTRYLFQQRQAWYRAFAAGPPKSDCPWCFSERWRANSSGTLSGFGTTSTSANRSSTRP